MRIFLTILIVIGLGMIVFIGASAGEIPFIDMLPGAGSGEELAGGGNPPLATDQQEDLMQMIDTAGDSILDGLDASTMAVQQANEAFLAEQETASLQAQQGAPANSQTNGQCWDIVVNPSFEQDFGWSVPVTEYTAQYSTEQFFDGARSMKTGITDETQNVNSFSSAS